MFSSRLRPHGFTLIELLVVVTMIGILLAIAVPSFTSFISNYRATAAVNDLLQGIMLTRGEALKRGRRVTMLPNMPDAARTPSTAGSWANGWTIFVDQNPNKALDSSEVVIFKHGDLPASTTISAPSGTTSFNNANYVSFDGTGYPTLYPTTGQLSGGVVITDQIRSIVNRRTLCMAGFGRPRIVKDTIETCVSG